MAPERVSFKALYAQSAVAQSEKSPKSPGSLHELTLRRWWPPLLWVGAILTATSIPGRFIPAIGPAQTDKAVHLTMYGVLAFLIARSLDDPARPSRIRAAIVALLVCSAMGAADEWHQLYIPGRDADVADWAADSVGGLVGAASWLLKTRKPASAA